MEGTTRSLLRAVEHNLLRALTAKRSGLEALEMHNHGNCTAPG